MARLYVDMEAGVYHDDPAGTPSLSSTVARTLLLQTPAHAKAQHPKLTDQPVWKDSLAMDTGTAIHQLLLGEDRIEVLGFTDWRTDASKQARDDVRSRGRVPMLSHQWEQATVTADAIRDQVAKLDVRPLPFTVGKREQTVVWHENDVICRARMDWLRDDHTVIDDLKTTGRSAAPSKWAAGLFRDGYDIQAAFYTRAIERLTGRTPVFRFVVAETAPPYGVSVIQLSEQAMFAAQVKVDTAVQLWRDCLERDEWPGYDTGVYVADPPGWMRPERDAWENVDTEGVPF